MASLGQLTIDMVANLGGFETDMRRASRTMDRETRRMQYELRRMDAQVDATRQKFTRLTGVITGLGAVGLGLAAREVRNFVQAADGIDKVRRTVVLTAEELQELRFAAEQVAGVASGTLDMAMQRFARRSAEAAQGTGVLAGLVKDLGIDLRNADGSIKSQTELLGLFADRVKNTRDEQEQLRIAFSLFDSEGSRLVQMLRLGSEGIDEFRERARAAGGIITGETIDAAVKFNDAIHVLRENLRGVSIDILSGVIQPLSEYADWLANTEEGQEKFTETLKVIADTAKTLATVVGVALVGATTRYGIVLAVAEVRAAKMAAAVIAKRAAADGYTAAATRAAIATKVLGRAVNVALGPIGIAIGVLSTLGIVFLALKDDIIEVTGEFDEFENRMRRLRESSAGFRLDQLKDDLETSRRELADINRQIEALADPQVPAHIQNEDVRQLYSAKITELHAEQTAKLIEKQKEKEENIRLLTESIEKLNNAEVDNIDLTDILIDTNEQAADTYRSTSAAALNFRRQLEDLSDSLAGGTASATRRFARQMAEAVTLFRQGEITLSDLGRALDLYRQQLQAATSPDVTSKGLGFGLDGVLDSLSDIREEMEEIARIEWGFENLIDSFHPLAGMMRQLGDAVDLVNARIEAGRMSEMEGMFVKSGMAASAAFSAMMSGVDRTSKEYARLERAQQVTNIALGIAAILQQGMGDPYTAIPRMVAMAAMVASLGVSTGLSGGGAASRQQSQGTGSVLGDADAKSESIANAVEITADATSKLVGISRAQLHALQQLQQGISGAAGMVARGAADLDVSGISVGMSGLESLFKSFDPLGYAIDSLIGGLFGFGKTKVEDQGIALIGGMITDMLDGAVAQAFADMKRKSLFGSRSASVFEDLDDAFNSQMNLIFKSMIDTVRAAGDALGIPLSEIEARIASFEVEAQKISLMDLTAEEQQAELAAVFSRIFDDFAGHVIPFIGQFQQIGEGLAETLVRVATSVQVTEEAIHRLGLTINEELGPERMAQVSVGLIEAAGGIEAFISSMEDFIAKFAPASHQFALAESDITRALEQMGFALPAGRDGFWELAQSIDITTEAGQRQLATLLGLADAADTYYSALEAVENERQGLLTSWMRLQGDTNALRELELQKLDESNHALQRRIWALEDEMALVDLMTGVNDQILQALSPAHAELNRIVTTFDQMYQAAVALGASEDQLLRIRQLASAQISAFAASLEVGIAASLESLFGSAETTMTQTASAVSSSMDSIQSSMINALQGVRDWMDSSMLSGTSPLLPEQRLAEAQRQFDQAISSARSGDVDAMSDLPGLANQLLSEGGGFWGTSTAEFDALWMQVRAAMGQVAAMDMPDMRPPTREQMGAVQAATEATAKSAYQQMLEAQHLVGQISVLSQLTGKTPSEIAAELGVPMGDLIEAMGLNPEATAEALDQQFNDVVTGYGDAMDPLLGYANEQLQELIKLNANFNTLAGLLSDEYSNPGAAGPGERGGSIGDRPGRDGDPQDGQWEPTPPPDPAQPPPPGDGSYVAPQPPPWIDPGHGFLRPESVQETNERLERVEALLEEGIRYQRDTAVNTREQARGTSDLIVIEREKANRPQPIGRIG